MLSGTPHETLRYDYTLRLRHPGYTALRQLVPSRDYTVSLVSSHHRLYRLDGHVSAG
jgi:hypothetical protein